MRHQSNFLPEILNYFVVILYHRTDFKQGKTGGC